jgi:uncharacterized membrane protein YidH (DUF202 family)
MFRTQNLFALTAIGLLGLGLVLPQFGSQTGLFTISTSNRTHSYAFGNEMPLYCIAALFAAFAFLYSIGYIPFHPTMARWHFWLSLISVFLCLAGAAIFAWYAQKAPEPELGVGGTVVAASFAGGVLTFVSMQLWFAVDLARALLTMRKHR